MRIAVAGLAREANSFAGGEGRVSDFRRDTWCTGPEILELIGRDDSLAGALQLAQERSAAIVPTFHARSNSGPAVAGEDYVILRSRLLDAVAAVAGRIDGIYVRLHGAMTAEGCEDVEGDILAALRELVGPSKPIAASFDLHAHMTRKIIGATPLIAGYHTYPHIDMISTGRRAMRLLLNEAAGTARHTAGYRKIPVMSASEAHNTTNGPVAEVARLRDRLTETGMIVDGSIFTTQPWLDVADLGWSVVVVTDHDQSAAQRHADKLAVELFDRRTRLTVTKTPLRRALDRVRTLAGARGPVVLGDGADSPSAGSTGDGPDMLKALLAEPLLGPALCSIVDRQAVQVCLRAGVGARVTLPVGGSLSPHFFQPITITGQVITLTDGTPADGSQPISAGRCAVISLGHVFLVVSEFPTAMTDDRLYRRVGLDPKAACVVQAKSAGQYREGFKQVSTEMIDVDMRGPSQHDLTTLPFLNLQRPPWPIAHEVERGW